MAAIDERLAPLFRIGLLALSLIASSSVPADDEVALADPTELDFLSDMPVVLSVSRLAQPLPEAPGAITVIDREMIRASGFLELPDVLRLVPGFLVGHLTGGMTTVNYHALAEDNSRRMQVLIEFQHSARLRDDLRVVWGVEGRRDAVHSTRLYGTDKDLTSTLARCLKFGAANAEIAAGVQNLTGDYVDFNDVNILSRRAYLSVAAEF